MASRVVRAPVEFPREFRNRFANEQLDLHARSYLSCRRSPVHSSVPRFFRISRGVLLRRNLPSSERVRKKERGRKGRGGKKSGNEENCESTFISIRWMVKERFEKPTVATLARRGRVRAQDAEFSKGRQRSLRERPLYPIN